MKLSDSQIESFQKLYKKHFGEEISRDVALDKGLRLLQLIEAVYKPINKKQVLPKKHTNNLNQIFY
jgi:hypothetical protein